MVDEITHDVYLSGSLKRGLNMPYVHTFICGGCGRTCQCQNFCKSSEATEKCECGRCFVNRAEEKGKTGFTGCHVIYLDEFEQPKRIKGEDILELHQFHKPIEEKHI
ncbi:MAG: hypothetical protein ABIH76_06345 [Candidatus Bathyarchaeota archaeon]